MGNYYCENNSDSVITFKVHSHHRTITIKITIKKTTMKTSSVQFIIIMHCS